MSRPLLATDRVTAERASPSTWIYVLHGIYGAGRNWSSVLRRLVRERPEIGAVLVDLREHGDSKGFPPPHTLEAAAGDLYELAESLDIFPDALLGHSFGGKVALQYARDHPGSLRQVWVVDSTPSAREPSGSAWEMLDRLRGLAAPFASRDDVIEGLARQGVARPIGQWMATNLERTDGELRWRLDFDVVEALLRDFFRRDLWDVVESPPEPLEVHVVKAEASSVLSEEDVARIGEAAARTGRVHLHRVRGGHWVNADNPEAIHALLLRHL